MDCVCICIHLKIDSHQTAAILIPCVHFPVAVCMNVVRDLECVVTREMYCQNCQRLAYTSIASTTNSNCQIQFLHFHHTFGENRYWYMCVHLWNTCFCFEFNYQVLTDELRKNTHIVIASKRLFGRQNQKRQKTTSPLTPKVSSNSVRHDVKTNQIIAF